MPTYNPSAAAGLPSSVAYAEFATDVTISATTEAAADLIVTAPSFTPNGRDSFWVEFGCPGVAPGASSGAAVNVVLFDNGSPIFAGTSIIASFINNAAAAVSEPLLVRIKVTNPTAAVHAYSIRAFRVTANGTVNGTLAGTARPGYVSITRDV